jgi:hypothetical protein
MSDYGLVCSNVLQINKILEHNKLIDLAKLTEPSFAGLSYKQAPKLSIQVGKCPITLGRKKLILCEVVLFSHVFICLDPKDHHGVQYSAYCIY